MKQARLKSVVRAAVLVGVALVSACDSGTGGGRLVDAPLETFTPNQIFERGEYELARKRPDKAANYFAEIERLYPYSEWAKRAIVMQAFSHHKAKEFEEARSAAQRYLDVYPTDEDAPYAAFLLALSFYDQIENVGRDQGMTFQSLQALRTVIENYPDSDYARSAKLKFDLAFDHLAGKEMEIGRYYLKRDRYTAAINRFRVVVADFQTTTHTPEALHRLVESYLSLGLVEEAQTAGAILGYNYRSNPFYADSYKLLAGNGLVAEPVGEGWLRAIYRQVIKGEWY